MLLDFLLLVASTLGSSIVRESSVKLPSASLHIPKLSRELRDNLHNKNWLIEVNVEDLGIDCVGDDSKEVRNFLW